MASSSSPDLHVANKEAINKIINILFIMF
jgi:hypothetical protein